MQRSTSERPSSTSATLLERAKARDPDAWQRLVNLYSPLAYHWCRGYGLSTDDAADAVQEVFQAVAGGLVGFRRERQGDTFRGWLHTITRNKLRDHFRRRGRQPLATGGTDAQKRLLQLPDPACTEPDEQSASRESKVVFQSALDLIRTEFEDRTWQAFWRVTVEDQYPADVAADLGITSNAVYKAKSRILRRLREEVSDWLKE